MSEFPHSCATCHCMSSVHSTRNHLEVLEVCQGLFTPVGMSNANITNCTCRLYTSSSPHGFTLVSHGFTLTHMVPHGSPSPTWFHPGSPSPTWFHPGFTWFHPHRSSGQHGQEYLEVLGCEVCQRFLIAVDMPPLGLKEDRLVVHGGLVRLLILDVAVVLLQCLLLDLDHAHQM